MINEQFDTSGDMDNLYNQLKDGRKLCQYVSKCFIFFLSFLLKFFCRLMNSISPNAIRKINMGIYL